MSSSRCAAVTVPVQFADDVPDRCIFYLLAHDAHDRRARLIIARSHRRATPLSASVCQIENKYPLQDFHTDFPADYLPHL